MTSAFWTILLAEAVERDLAQILEHTGTSFGTKQAIVYKETLLAAMAALREGPHLPGSRRRDDIAPGLYALHVARQGRRGRHFIIYREEPERSIKVLRLLHDKMDLPRHVMPEF